MAYELGNTVKVTVGTTLIGGQQNCTLARETETGDTTTKDSGVWSESEATGLSWSIDCDGLIAVDDEAITALETAWESMQTVTIKYGKAGSYKTGKAIIGSLEQNAPMKEKCTYSVSFTGVGPLTNATSLELQVEGD